MMNNLQRLMVDGRVGDQLLPASYVDYRVLVATTHEVHTVPSGAKTIVVTPVGADVYVKSGGTAAIPAADVTDGSGSIVIPDGQSRAFPVLNVATLGLISAGTPKVMLECYS